MCMPRNSIHSTESGRCKRPMLRWKDSSESVCPEQTFHSWVAFESSICFNEFVFFFDVTFIVIHLGYSSMYVMQYFIALLLNLMFPAQITALQAVLVCQSST